jgi:hypothetical protein
MFQSTKTSVDAHISRAAACINFEQEVCYDRPSRRVLTMNARFWDDIMISKSQMQYNREAPTAFLDIGERRLAKHAPVAQALRAAAAPVVEEIIALARLQVERWEENSLCSKDYILAWRQLLKDPAEAAQILEERSSRAAALRQNSPFVATVRKFQAQAHAA